MIKKATFGLLTFAFGIVIAYNSASFLFELTQNLHIWISRNKIEFYGKNLMFPNIYYYLSFGISIMLFAFICRKSSLKSILLKIFLWVIVFGILIIGISALSTKLKLIECTACDDRIRRMKWNEINSGFLIIISLFTSLTPFIVKSFIRIKTDS